MYYNNKFMDGCPVEVCDPSQVRVRDLRGGLIGKLQSFHGNLHNSKLFMSGCFFFVFLLSLVQPAGITGH